MTGVAVMVVDKLGRRPLLLGGVSGIVSFCCHDMLNFQYKLSKMSKLAGSINLLDYLYMLQNLGANFGDISIKLGIICCIAGSGLVSHGIILHLPW